MDDSASIFCAREIRGTISIEVGGIQPQSKVGNGVLINRRIGGYKSLHCSPGRTLCIYCFGGVVVGSTRGQSGDGLAHYADSLVGGGGKGVVPLIVVSIITPVIISPVESDIGIIPIGKSELGIKFSRGFGNLRCSRCFDNRWSERGEGCYVGQTDTALVLNGESIFIGSSGS